MANLYDKAGLVNIPVGYQDGFLYNIKPEDNTLGFRFNRDSAATRVNKEGLIEQVGYFGPELVQNGDFSQLSPELVVNGDFATDSNWTKGAGWSISGGVATLDGTQVGSSGLSSTLMPVVSGKTYKIVVNVLSKSSGFRLYDNYGVIAYGLSVGENVFYRTALSSSNYQIIPLGLSGSTGSIDNISVKQVDPNNYWTLGTGWSIEDGKAVATNAADAERLRQDDVFTAGKTYKVTYEITEISQGGFRGYVGGTNLTIHSTVGVYTETLVAPAIDVFYIRTVGTTSGSIENVSVVEILGDKPRIDYTDSLTSPSFLLEPQSTNLITFSENLKKYENSNTICTSNYAISPDGTKNATRVDFTASSTNALGVNGAVNNGETITQSVFVKYIDAQFVQLWFGSSGFSGGNTNFDLINGTTSNPSGSSSTMKNMGNGWWRISSTRTATSTSSNTGVFKLVVVDSLTSSRFGDEANGSVLVFGGQYEKKSYPTSYIPTAGSTVTRAQETCNGAGSASTFNSTEGVLYAEIAALADDGTYRQILLHDSSYNNRIALRYMPTSNQINVYLYNGTVQSEFYYNLSNVLDFNKIAFKYQQNNFSLYVNGIEVGADTSGTTFSANTLQKVDFDFENNYFFYGKIKGVYVFNEALTDDELQQLTGPEYNSFAALAAAYNYTVI
jgi:hypothetical protein